MSWQSTMRAVEAAQRRRERDAVKRQRELDRHAREQLKLSEIDDARLEVETYENRLDVLLSVHKTQGETWDWLAVAAALPPLYPQKRLFHEMKARQTAAVWRPERRNEVDAVIEQARTYDEQEFQAALKTYTEQLSAWEKLGAMARRILSGEHKALIEALVELSPLTELSDLGSQMHFTVESTELIVCELKVNGLQAIPSEVKSLTATEKLSVKPMPKARFHEIYQDYICSCVLRVAKEVFAILPTDILLITASADMPDMITSGTREKPVLSAAISRKSITDLPFEDISPSEAMGKFTYRSNFKASRKSGAFQSVIPLTPAEISHLSTEGVRFSHLVGSINTMRNELRSRIAALTVRNPDPESSAAI